MVSGPYKIAWSADAKRQLKAAYKYIAKDSVQNAQKVSSEIVAAARKLAVNPGHYAPDEYKLENDGSYRAFELYKYRISYRVLANEIRILRMRHTKM